MVAVRTRIPNVDPGLHTLKLRVRNPSGSGPETDETQIRVGANRKARNVRLDGDWADMNPPALARILKQTLARTTRSETGLSAQASDLRALQVQVRETIATILQSLTARIEEAEGEIDVNLASITSLQAAVGLRATIEALNALTARVTENETGISANASEITALDARIAGQALGPPQNEFGGTSTASKADAEALRDAYASANPEWLAQYDADDDLHIRLLWGVLRVFQNRENGSWEDSTEIEATAGAVTTLNATAQANTAAISAAAAQITQLIADVADRATVTALQELSVRVDSNEGNLARWLVKLTVDDLVGGVGLYNDGTTIRFIVAADKFAILPPGAVDDDEVRVPFIVDGGRVYLDTAIIRNGTITSLQAANAFLTNLTAVHGTLAQARIQKADIFGLTISGIIQSVNYSASAGTGFFINRDGTFAFYGGTFRGDLQSDNFNGVIGDDGSITGIGSLGWYLGRNGAMVLDLANVRGTLTADHIAADVRNWDGPLWNGSLNDSGSGTATLAADASDYTWLYFVGGARGGSFGFAMEVNNILATTAGTPPLRQGPRILVSDESPTVGIASDRRTVHISSTQADWQLRQVWGIKGPATSGTTPAGTDATRTETVRMLSGSRPAVPSGGTDVENHIPTGWTNGTLTATSTQDVWAVTRTARYADGLFRDATVWGNLAIETPRVVATTTRTETIYIQGSSVPAAPGGGTTAALGTVPTGWSGARLAPTTTLDVYRATRTVTLRGGVFVSSTAWGGVTLDRARTGTGPPVGFPAPSAPGLSLNSRNDVFIRASDATPAGARGFQIRSARRLSSSSSWPDWRVHTAVGGNRNFSFSNSSGTQIRAQIRWVGTDGSTGPWSATSEITVP